MFGLPGVTVLVMFGFPLFWIIWTLVFLYVSRNWGKGEGEKGGGK